MPGWQTNRITVAGKIFTAAMAKCIGLNYADEGAVPEADAIPPDLQTYPAPRRGPSFREICKSREPGCAQEPAAKARVPATLTMSRPLAFD
jgi:hypothetical protein